MKRYAIGGFLLSAAACALPLVLIRGRASAQDSTGYEPPYIQVTTQPLQNAEVITNLYKSEAPKAPSSSCASRQGNPAPVTCTPSTCSLSPPPPPPPALTPSPVVADLLAVLAETKSKDTYVATVVVLGKMGAEARPALGPALRNGERLKVFDGAFGTDAGKRQGASIVLQALATIAEGQSLQAVGYSPTDAARGQCATTR